MQDFLEKYLPWFTLRQIPSLGYCSYKRLIDRFGTPENILSASPKELKTIPRISSKALDGIKTYQPFQNNAKEELISIFHQGIKITTLNDASYPKLLCTIHDPPPVLTYYGELNNDCPPISIVGSRNATSYGLNTAQNLACNLGSKGFCIVSGMARGIDSAAHRGCLKAQAKTIAVLGSGLNKIYPAENKTLFSHIIKSGAVVSEFPIDADPVAANFPIRNRIIAGISAGTIVVEAAKRSGSLITARLAADYNREVFAVPGSIRSQKSQGTHSLLKQGAKLVENEMDIIDELHHMIHAESKESAPKPLQKQSIDPQNKVTTKENTILNTLDPYPKHIDLIIDACGIDSAAVSSGLLELELQGIVERHQGNYFSISKE
ncbi:MAG: DNA-protecting protein DprA [Desulfobacteraceae bacterium]|nr:DNA-protecting protein DprA [Desulfobacteraceae bacterium]